MWNQYYYFDLPKIRVGQAHTTKNYVAFAEQMKISCIMSISRILIDLCAIRQKVRIKNTFADIVYNSVV